jgi:2-polyprenyl-6-methoxyphenol hydroxylase-like FAD-dependent oxidoreductase
MTDARLRNRNVLISGASVAGPALAYWLRRRGFNPTVVERAPALCDGGYAVDFRGPVHLDLLARMGVREDIERARTGTGAMWYVDERGKRLARLPADQTGGDLEILRGDLARILHSATAGGTEYRFDDAIAAMTEDADGVHVTFERSAPRTFDLVIGADGLHSRVRALAFGPEADYVRDLGLYCAIFTAPNDLALERTGLAYSTPNRLVAVYSARQNTEAKVLLYFGSPPLDYDRRDVEQQRAIVAREFAEVGWVTPRLLAAMRTAPDFYFDSISQVRMDRWSRGRVALVGDAGYCPSSLSGMGTGLAIVGAYVLAGELAAAGGDHGTAFARYEAAMRSYVAGCQKLGDGVAGWMVPRSRFMAWFVRLNFKLFPYVPWKGAVANAARRTASAITLADYPG